MNHLKNLVKWDIILLHRNMLFLIAAFVALVYVGIFYLLRPLGNLDLILIILIFNDPVVTCFIFSAVIWLFDKNQATLQAVSVLPVSIKMYILSKIIILSSLAAIIALVMAVATQGTNLNFPILLISVFLSGFIFSCLGFIAGAYSKSFNQFLLYAAPFLILTGLPFLSLFDIGSAYHFILLPSTGGIEMLNAAFNEKSWWFNLLMLIHLLLACYIAWAICIKVVRKKLI